mmetsp:Transcript_1947/g.4954  ORF Transcript_1947/g.4954 Transcript_1947/m.4954 type:complete len:170 (+) Transcript_1947:70-579(+)
MTESVWVIMPSTLPDAAENSVADSPRTQLHCRSHFPLRHNRLVMYRPARGQFCVRRAAAHLAMIDTGGAQLPHELRCLLGPHPLADALSVSHMIDTPLQCKVQVLFEATEPGNFPESDRLFRTPGHVRLVQDGEREVQLGARDTCHPKSLERSSAPFQISRLRWHKGDM